LIGNGWIAPTEQYLAYLPFAYKEGLIQGGTAEAKQVEAAQATCAKALNAGSNHVDVPQCEEILTSILRVTNQPTKGDQACVNMYDVRLRDSYPSCGMNWPGDLEQVTPYLRRTDVVQALHINPDKRSGWQECSGPVGRAFSAKNSKPSVQLLPEILETVPIVLFSGDKDLICNHLGTEDLIHNLNWNGGTGFEVSPGVWAPKRHWTFEDEPAGIYQEARNLTYVLFYNSSHMVPFDYSRRSRNMLDRFLAVDIGSIGGKPADSRIDGEKGIETSVGGHPNSTIAEEKEKERLSEATWNAYYKSGEVALIVVALAAGIWGIFVYRSRKAAMGYEGLAGSSLAGAGIAGANSWRFGARRGLEAFRAKRTARNINDIEAADFDESELDDLHVATPTVETTEGERERYSLGGGSSDEGEVEQHNEKPQR
jgi:carboxypeptidase D